MALVNSDLFLVQDAVSKTNYKVSFQNLSDQIDTSVNLDTVVAIAGDNMTGNLTLGTNKIVLNVDGGALFGEDRVTVFSYGVIETWRKTSNGPDKLHSWHSNVDGSRVERIRFNANGSGDFVGDITANAFAGDGSALTNLPVEPGLWVEAGNALSPITAGRDLTSVKDITATGNIGANNITASGDIGAVNAVFTGTLEALSIDGGTYS